MREFDDAAYDYGLEPGESFDPEDLEDEPFDLTRPHVLTALGPIDPGALGFTVCVDLGAFGNGPAILAELEAYFYAGGRAVVDLGIHQTDDVRWAIDRAPIHVVLAGQSDNDMGIVQMPGDDTTLLEILASGVTVAIEWPIGQEATRGVEVVRVIARIFADEYGDRLLLHATGNAGLANVVDYTPLMLMEAGLTAPQVRQLFIENPAQALAVRSGHR